MEATDEIEDMPEYAELKWGETPFTHMTHEELLFAANQMYAACVSARSVLRMSSMRGDHYYWDPQEGSGGRALNKLDQVVEPTEEKYSPEKIYRSFFRYADDVLFTNVSKSLWAICPECGVMTSPCEGSNAGRRCGDILRSECNGVVRLLELGDLATMKE